MRKGGAFHLRRHYAAGEEVLNTKTPIFISLHWLPFEKNQFSKSAYSCLK